jgi:hypothetical protein
VHFALSVAALAREIELPTVTHCAEPPFKTVAATEESLVQVQDEVDAQAKLNSELQGKVVPVPALSVLVSKLISKFEPSLLNAAEVRIGAGRGAEVRSTATFRLAGYCTSYWYADCPETVTL